MASFRVFWTWLNLGPCGVLLHHMRMILNFLYRIFLSLLGVASCSLACGEFKLSSFFFFFFSFSFLLFFSFPQKNIRGGYSFCKIQTLLFILTPFLYYHYQSIKISKLQLRNRMAIEDFSVSQYSMNSD